MEGKPGGVAGLGLLDIEIVGVAGDTKYENLRDEVPYELYVPSSYKPGTAMPSGRNSYHSSSDTITDAAQE